MTRSPRSDDPRDAVMGRVSIGAAARAVIVARVEACGGAVLVASAAVLLSLLLPPEWTLYCRVGAVLAGLSAAIESAVIAPAGVRQFRVELAPTGLVIHRGALWRSVEHVPWPKVVVIRQQTGPLLHRLGLARCVIFTPAKEVTLLPMSPQDVHVIIAASLARSA
ncbi:PH domain-containing protein [Curtobacterium sp. JUb34]|uniref:PH domain-containing protein n=1 Tax=Curtobacterium sp. JUb34 TaxID=2485109 RepID=UPI0011CEC85F|nr:PH domain-containing protein [Curtobacterium sp. JUb34]